jgi:hypothetical protein
MTVTTSHLTEPYGDSLLHYWELRGLRGAVSLSAVEMRSKADAEAVAAAAHSVPSLAPLLGGAYIFDVAQTHWDRPGGLGCSRHGDGCDMDAFVSSVALPVWQHAVAGGLTDEVVYAELQPLFAVEYGQVKA